MPRPNALQATARYAVAASIAASLAMLLWLSPVLDPLAVLGDKLNYLAEHHFVWTVSWILWIGAALSLIAFMAQWGVWIDAFTDGRLRGWAVFGVLCAALGMIPDTIAETIYLGILPGFALTMPATGDAVLSARFDEWDKLARLLTGFLGNGLYCVGGLTLQILSVKSRCLNRYCLFPGFFVWLCGFGLSAAALANHTVGLYLFTALTMAGFTLWAGAVGCLTHPERRA